MNHSTYYISCDVISPYYLMQPFGTLGNNVHCLLIYCKGNCPFYAPFSRNSTCRFCGHYALQHRKYYIYSHYARIIQKRAIRYIYEKMCKKVWKELHATVHVIDFFVQKERYYYKNYRKWNEKVFSLICTKY